MSENEPDSAKAKPDEMLSDEQRKNLEIERQRREELSNGGLDRLLDEVKTNAFGDSFARFREFSEEPKAKEFFSNILKDKPLVDLGCGNMDMSEDYIYEIEYFAMKSGSSGYVGVDKFRTWDDERVKKVDRFEAKTVREDMLKYVFNLPNNSVNIVMNGINNEIIDNIEYIENLLKEIARVVTPGGVAMGNESPFLSILSAYGFNKIQPPDTVSEDLAVWQKPTEKNEQDTGSSVV